MNQPSKLSNVVRNAGVGILIKLLLVFLAFFKRTCFIYLLSEDYLGINGLYSNILNVLNLANLGVDTVLMYFLYEPLVHRDERRLSSLIYSFRRIFYLIGGVIFALGLLVVPLLPHIITGSSLDRFHLTLYYLIFLSSSALSYLGGYRCTLLMADQQGHIESMIQFIQVAAEDVVSILVLYYTRSFTAYLLVMILGTGFRNIILHAVTRRKYPFLRQAEKISMKEISGQFSSSLRSAFVYRIGLTLINSTDYILVSMIVSTAAVGFYSNYVLITANLLVILNMITAALTAGIGHFNVDTTPRQKETLFASVQLIYYGMAAFVASCLITMMNDFMILWIRDPKYILPQSFVVILALKVSLDIVIQPNRMFRESAGLFGQVKYVVLTTALLNIFLSIPLGHRFGLSGIIFATIISNLVTLYWYEPKVFYRQLFQSSFSRYWPRQLRFLFTFAAAILISGFSAALLPQGFVGCVLKILVSGLVTGCVFLPFLFLTEEGRFLKSMLLRILHREF